MTGNELFEPLTGHVRPMRPWRARSAGLIGLAVAFSGLGLGVHLAADPGRTGGAVAVGTLEVAATPLPPPPPPVAASVGAAAATPTAGLAAMPPMVRTVGQSVEIQNGVKIYRPIMGAEVAAAAPVVRTVEAPSDASAPVAFTPVEHDPRPRVALLYGGLGFDRAATAKAAAALPAAVTFGFTPYGEALESQVEIARRAGHAILLQLPMEGFGQTETPPDHMLTTDAGRTPRDLAWLLNRFRGYDGVSNLLGARVLSSDAALRPVAEAVAARGLYFLEDGNIERSALDPISQDVRLTTGRADVVLDARRGAGSLAQDLVRLRDLARERGTAIGTVIATPGTLDALTRFAARLPSEGIDLVSVSDAVGARRATATAGLALSR